MNKNNWEGIKFPSEKGDWKKFENNDVIIAVNSFHAKKEKKYVLLIFQKITFILLLFQQMTQTVRKKLLF